MKLMFIPYLKDAVLTPQGYAVCKRLTRIVLTRCVVCTERIGFNRCFVPHPKFPEQLFHLKCWELEQVLEAATGEQHDQAA